MSDKEIRVSNMFIDSLKTQEEIYYKAKMKELYEVKIKDLQQKVEQLEGQLEEERLNKEIAQGHRKELQINEAYERNRANQLEKIRKEAIKYIEYYCIGNLEYENKTHKVLLNILNKGSESNE